MPAFSYSSRAVNLSHRRKRNRIAEAFDECDAQRGVGRQNMSLSLSFVAGKVTGSGCDVIGRFDFAGVYDLKTGRVQMTKHYEHAHRVQYIGANEGDGMWLWGVWSVGGDRGGFHLWPEGEEDPTQRRLKAAKELPKSQRLKRGKLVEALVP